MSFTLVPFNLQNSELAHFIAALWNAACGSGLAVTSRLVELNLRSPRGVLQVGWFSRINGEPVGLILASAYRGDPTVTPPDIGWVDALAVSPTAQRRGIGSALLNKAEEWLRAQGCTQARLGGGLRYFVPGLPAELKNERFFSKRGYDNRAENSRVWDVGRDLGGEKPGFFAKLRLGKNPGFLVRPARSDDADALRDFFTREFPGRWRYEFEQYLADGGDIGDYTILLTERGLDAFCQITFEDSLRPIEHFYMHALPRPWGQAGPLGVSADRRGSGLGAVIVDGALERLRAAGVRGCVIDWTDLVEFYARFGFTPHREYLILIKPILP